jgi:HEAT repeat protein
MRTWLCALVLALASAGCSENDDPNTAGYWLDRLDQRSERADALKNLGRIKDKTAAPEIAKWLKKDGDWQPDAAYALGELGDPSAVPELVAAIDFGVGASSDNASRRKNRVNVSVMRALTLLKATGEAGTVLRLLEASDDRVREAALVTLGHLGQPQSLEAIIGHVTSSREQPLVRLAAIEALSEMGDAKGVPALVEALYTELPNASFYEAARFALVRVGEPAVPELLRALERKHAKVEAMKLPDGNRMPDGAIEARAASTLGAMRAQSAEGALTATLAKLYDRAKKGPRGSSLYAAAVEVAYALGNLGTPSAANALLPLVKDTNPDIRLAACEALITTGNRAVVKDLLNAAKAGNTQARAAALVAASRMGGGSDLPAFEALAKSGDKVTPNHVMAELVSSEKSRLLAAKACAGDPACWKTKLGEGDGRVRERAAYELGWLQAKDAVPDLLKAAVDTDADVRMAAVLSLHRFNGVDAEKLQAIYDEWQAKLEYAGVNHELKKLIARQKSKKQ